MNSNRPFPPKTRAEIFLRHGYAESHFENMLRDSILLAAAFTGAQAALVLQDDTGTWYRDSSGLTSEQLADLEPVFSQRSVHPAERHLPEHGPQVLEALPLLDACQHSIGTLYLLSPVPIMLSEAQREGLRLLAEHVQTIVTMDHQQSESRTNPRAPSAASFVPGLVHELGSFIFGISANLDAFEARFAGLDEVGRYGANIRRSLDRMAAFIVELREYGYPQRLSWTRTELEPLLREAVETNRPLATANHIDLQLQVEGVLPPIDADEATLRATFIRLIDLVLKQEDAGGHVVLHAATGHQGNRVVVCGFLECASMKFKDVDQARLFEPFYFRVSGLGRLTLPGARRVLESHGGTLTAGLGQTGGMRISFVLPSELPYPQRSSGQT